MITLYNSELDLEIKNTATVAIATGTTKENNGANL